MNRRDLPIFELEAKIVAELRHSSRLILQAPTGSGKSTQVPQILLDHGFAGPEAGEIVVLQPRRLATRMLAARVASERNCRPGEEVGYQIRFDKVAGPRTRIRFVTEGVLLRQMIGDPELKGIAAILFDEFHERHLYGDITLARALMTQEQSRPELKLIVMSATLEAAQLKDYLAPCAILSSTGRTHPVEIEYLEKSSRPDDSPVWELAASEYARLAEKSDGDALIFMPGAYEISRTVQALKAGRAGAGAIILPLHGELPPADQDAAVAQYDRRKIVVATNVAETSLTIDGVRIVIDSGLARIARYDPNRGINTLLVEKISRASADQRAGRAGRTAPGRALRLWTEREHLDRPGQELPEIRRLDLAEVVLTLKASGVENIASFRWLEPPDPKSLRRAETLLVDLGAVNPATGQITGLGRRMLAFPVHPRYARMLLEADARKCVRSIALVSALTQGRYLLRRSEGKQMDQEREEVLGERAESDFFILMRAWRFAEQTRFDIQRCRRLGINAAAAREAGQLFEQFLRIARDERLEVNATDDREEAIQRCVLAGFSDQLALRLDAGTLRCAMVHGRKGVLARESAVQQSNLFVASEVREIDGKDGLQTLLTLATAIEEPWLREAFPEAFREVYDVSFDIPTRRIVARKQTWFRDLLLRSEGAPQPPLEQAAAILADQVAAGNCPLANWDNAVEQWIIRLNRLREWMPELNLPGLDETERLLLMQQICHGAVSYKEIKERPVWQVVKSWLSAQQQAWVEEYTPERINLPNGRKAKVTYDKIAPPTIASRIQDLYGVTESLRIAAGRVTVVIQVLAPNHRPIQVTQNLSTFWKESYPKIKQELQRKYPKHEWR